MWGVWAQYNRAVGHKTTEVSLTVIFHTDIWQKNHRTSLSERFAFKLQAFFLPLIMFHSNSPWRPVGLLLSPFTALLFHLGSHRTVKNFPHAKANQPYGYWKRNLLLNILLIWRTNILKSCSARKQYSKSSGLARRKLKAQHRSLLYDTD